jgi:hypothetical protein
VRAVRTKARGGKKLKKHTDRAAEAQRHRAKPSLFSSDSVLCVLSHGKAVSRNDSDSYSGEPKIFPIPGIFFEQMCL